MPYRPHRPRPRGRRAGRSAALRVLRRAAATSALTVAALPLVSGNAFAADAPFRTIARDLSSAATFFFEPQFVANDGKEVLGGLGTQPVVRDVVAGVTRPLISKPASVVAASTDLQVVALKTAEALDAADTNGAQDLYLLERATGKVSWLSKQPRLLPDGTITGRTDVYDAQISGNGRFVSWRIIVLDQGPTNSIPEFKYGSDSYRLDRSTGDVTKLASRVPVKADDPTVTNLSEALVKHSDSAGRVSVFGDGAIVDGRAVPLPMNLNGDTNVAVSSDARWIALQQPYRDPAISIVDTTSGAVQKVTPPSWLVNAGYTIRNTTAGGVVVTARFQRSPGVLRDAVGIVSRTTGSVTQIGGDLIAYQDTFEPRVSDNLAFGANGQVLGKLLNSAVLPGVEPAAADQPLFKWMSYADTSCRFNAYGLKEYARASVSLANTPRGIDPRTPASATVKVFKTTSPSTVYNAFSMAAGTTRALTVPQTGGWTYAATITFTDGTKASGAQNVDPHPAPICDPFSY